MNLQKTQKVFNKDGTLFGEYHYLEFLKFRIDYLEKVLKNEVPELYYENEYGGRVRIDEFSTSAGYTPFDDEGLSDKSAHLQMDIMIKEEKNN